MKNNKTKTIKAMVNLLDDPNDTVFAQIDKDIREIGVNHIATMQKLFDEDNNELRKERLSVILDDLKFDKLSQDLETWKTESSENLLDGLYQITKYGFPTFDMKVAKDEIAKMTLEIKDKLSEKSPKEIVHIFNQTILYDNGYNGNIRNYSGLNNSFINRVIEKKISNPIGLSSLYLMIARELGLNFIGINSPGHFLLGYANDKNEIDFYFDPFNNGKIIETYEFERWMKLNFNVSNFNDLEATNIDIVKRVMNNLIYTLYTSGEKTTAENLLEIADEL